MKKIFSLAILFTILFISTSCFSKEEEKITWVSPDYTLSTSSWGWWGTPTPQWWTRK